MMVILYGRCFSYNSPVFILPTLIHFTSAAVLASITLLPTHVSTFLSQEEFSVFGSTRLLSARPSLITDMCRHTSGGRNISGMSSLQTSCCTTWGSYRRGVPDSSFFFTLYWMLMTRAYFSFLKSDSNLEGATSAEHCIERLHRTF